MQEIQSQMTTRALQLLALPDNEPKLLLDIGCGSGLSGQVIEQAGHFWIGFDIRFAALIPANQCFGKPGNKMATWSCKTWEKAAHFDQEPLMEPLGTLKLRSSISALQWLCNIDKAWHKPQKRLKIFFETLYQCL